MDWSDLKLNEVAVVPVFVLNVFAVSTAAVKVDWAVLRVYLMT